MTQTIDFEAALTELEKVVLELEGDVKLERALNLFDRGMKLSLECENFLKGAEQKVEILKRSVSGDLNTEPFADQLLEENSEKGKADADSKESD